MISKQKDGFVYFYVYNTHVPKKLLILITIFGFLLRFWFFPTRYNLGSDHSRDAMVASEAVRQLQLPANGPFSSVGPITFGLWYYYLNILSVIIIPSEWAAWIMIGLISTVMIIIMYEIGRILDGKKLGLILAFLTAVSPHQISSATGLQPHSLIGPLTALNLLFFLNFLRSQKYRNFTLWGFILGITVNTHFQALGLMLLPAFILIKSKKARLAIPLLTGLFISLIPLLFFELNNHWFNSRNMIDYLFHGQYRVWTSNRWMTYLGKFWPEFTNYTLGIPVWFTYILYLLLGWAFFIRMKKKNLNTAYFYLLSVFIILLTIVRYYRGEKFFGYLQFFHPFIFIFSGIVLEYISSLVKSRKSLLIVSVFFTLAIIPLPKNFFLPDQFNRHAQIQLHNLTAQNPQAKFSVYLCPNSNDKENSMALLYLLYKNNLYDENGQKISFTNNKCIPEKFKILKTEIVNINQLKIDGTKLDDFEPLTPGGIYNEVARWWMDEKP